MRFRLLGLLFLSLPAAACGHHPAHHHHHLPWEGRARDGAFAAEALAAGAATVTMVAMDEADRREPPPPRPLTPPLVGKVLWAGSGDAVPAVTVTLRDRDDLVVLHATTDDQGWFRFPLPLPPSWYVLSVDEDFGRGSTRLWLRDRRPGHLDVKLAPRPPVD